MSRGFAVARRPAASSSGDSRVAADVSATSRQSLQQIHLANRAFIFTRRCRSALTYMFIHLMVTVLQTGIKRSGLLATLTLSTHLSRES